MTFPHIANKIITINSTSKLKDSQLFQEAARVTIQYPIWALGCLMAFLTYRKLVSRHHSSPDEIFPVVNKSKGEYVRDGRACLEKGLRIHGGTPFRVNTGMGSVTVLPSKYANEIKNDDRFDATKFLAGFWQSHIPGFEPYAVLGGHFLRDVIKTHLTTGEKLTRLSPLLSGETAAALSDFLGDDEDADWQELVLAETLMPIISRISSLILLGPELCRNDEWARLASSYPVKATRAAQELKSWGWRLNPVVHWFLPGCREMRSMLADARRILQSIMENRRQQKMSNPNVVFTDALEWCEQLASSKKEDVHFKYPHNDPATQQLALSIGSALTSNDLITQALLNICDHPELVEPLRAEMRTVLAAGWTKTTVPSLELLDSVLKETLRLKPIGMVLMGRLLKEDVTLSDGLVLPKGLGITVSTDAMTSPHVYENPEIFEGDRFLRRKNIGHHQLVSTTPEHMGFGLGAHACPGRFLGAHMSKIFLCHFLLNYDFKLAEGSTSEPFRHGFTMLASPTAKILVRKRKGGDVWLANL